jgi:hypothetical protein
MTIMVGWGLDKKGENAYLLIENIFNLLLTHYE